MPIPVKWKLGLIAFIVLAAAITAFPPSEKIPRGLDLEGGIYLLCRVVTDEAIEAELEDKELRVRNFLENKSVTFEDIKPVIDPAKNRFELRFYGLQADKADEFTGYFKDDYAYKLKRGERKNDWVLIADDRWVKEIREEAVEQTLRTINNRIDKLGVAEPTVQRQGLSGDRILIQLPGVDDPERVKDLISEVGNLEFKLVDSGPFDSRAEALAKYAGTEDNLPSSLELLTGEETDSFDTPHTFWWVIERLPVVTGRDLTHAAPDADEFGGPAVRFTLGGAGAKRFADVTGKNVGRRLAIVLEGKVESAPGIRERIPGNGQISGLDSRQEATDLTLVLNAGAHPASIQYLQENTVGPQLGKDSIRSGTRAAGVGFVMVIIFMVIYYKWSGINAVIALILNLILMGGALAFLGSVLTLPGIAGFILTIGMAVDANVLVFERIRENLRAGKTVKSSIEGGFAKAFMTIFDANVTTLIAALILFIYGTGPIRGFAIILSFGILASMFTAVFVSRTIFEALILRRKGKIERLSI